MNFDEQIEKLNEEVKCTLAPSPIHGIGVFALRDIKKGKKMFCFPSELVWYDVPYNQFVKLRPEIREIILAKWPSIINGSEFQSPNSAWLMSFMNHSFDNNSNEDIALRDIKKGEEVTEDYSLMPNYKKVFKFL